MNLLKARGFYAETLNSSMILIKGLFQPERFFDSISSAADPCTCRMFWDASSPGQSRPNGSFHTQQIPGPSPSNAKRAGRYQRHRTHMLLWKWKQKVLSLYFS